jgi:putative Mg2+ transporter-C (MgtC) family protein
MDLLLAELRAGLLTGEETARVIVRLLTALVAGGLAGIDRERLGKAAGLRTHILVSVGAALFVLTAELAGMTAQISAVIQGIAVGIGFIGGGAILKSAEDREIRGLTTAAGIWLTAAAGIAAGLGRLTLALVAGLLALAILNVLHRAEQAMGTSHSNRA